MKGKNRQRIKCIVGDLIACIFSVLCFNIFRYLWLFGSTGSSFMAWNRDVSVELGYIVFPPVMIAIYAVLGYYNNSEAKSRYEVLSNTVSGAIIGTLAIYFAIMVNDGFNDRMLHYSFLIALFISLTLPVLLWRFAYDYTIRYAIRHNKYSYNVLIVGSGKDIDEYAARLEKTNARKGYKVVGIVSDDEMLSASRFARYTFDDLNNEAVLDKVNAFVVHCGHDHHKSVVDTVNSLYSHGRSILVPLEHYNLITTRPRINNVVGEPLVDVTATGLSAYSSNLKRLGDIAASAVALVLLLPVYAALAFLVKLDSRGPVFYTQERVGLHRKPFKIIKFRSMIVDSEPNGPALSSESDSRVTRLGHVMRKYRLDELPQFWNVLRGDMSLVGPRPEREFYLKQLREREPAVCNIHCIRPGITSLGSVKFGYAGNLDDMMKRFYFDMLYLENMSFALDLKILFHTVVTVVTGKGV